MDINNILKGVDYFVIQRLAQVKDVRKRLRMGYVFRYIIFGLVMGSKSKLKLEEACLRTHELYLHSILHLAISK